MASNPGSIPAGGKDKISVVVNTGNRGGQTLRKSFIVTTNDPRHSQISLTVTGRVTALVVIDPSYVRLTGRQDDRPSTIVRIMPKAEFPFTVSEVKTTSEGNLQLDLKPLGENPARDGYQLVVTCTRSEVGSFRDTILVHTDLKQKPTLRIPVSGRIQPRAPEGTKGSVTK